MMAAYQNTQIVKLSLLIEQALAVSEQQKNITAIVDVVEDIKKGALFIAKQGDNFNPLSNIDAIIAKQPNAILCQQDNKGLHDLMARKLANNNIALIVVDDIQQATVFALQSFYQSNLQKLRLVGVTGTDGKSSVAMLFAMMNPKQTGVVGTLGYGRVNNIKFTGMTTPGIVALYTMLAEMADDGITTVIMEVSSHAITQQRIGGLLFDVAIITNLGSDHLDFHGSVTNYHDCKKSFINSDVVARTVINIDDKNLSSTLVSNKYGLAISLADLKSLDIEKIVYSENGLKLHFTKQGFDALALNLYGQFNAYNLLSVLGAYKQLGFDFIDVYNMLKNITAVEGRMEKITDTKGRTIFVDFAHTANGLKNALAAIRQHFNTKLILVFGCGGDRDTTKRPEMGKVAEQLADAIIITNDNPRSESSIKIAEQILAGMKNPDKSGVILDRKLAIKSALEMCKKGEILLVAGKGHERTQTNAKGIIQFHDATVIKEILGAEK